MSEDDRTTAEKNAHAPAPGPSLIQTIEEVYGSQASTIDPHRFGLLAVYHYGIRKGAKLEELR